MRKQYIIFIGPNENLKSQAIKSICNCKKLSRSSFISKSENVRTLADFKPISFAKICLDSGQTVHLLKIEDSQQLVPVLNNWHSTGVGVIMLIDHQNNTSPRELKKIIKEYESYLITKSLAIGVVNSNNDPLFSLDKYNQCLKELGYNAAALEVNPERYQDMSILLQSMLLESLYGVACA